MTRTPLCIVLTLAALLGSCRAQPPEAAVAHPRWAVDPARDGDDAPPLGRSLFDFAMSSEHAGQRAYDLPFPFENLLQRLRERAGCDPQRDCLRVVLVPLGRSLQRMSAAPDFFAHPRVVAAVVGEGDSTLRLKDRLYLGYQEQTGIIEVISYNEAAARFEFQIVHDYRAGAAPQVQYARRAVCSACHQNLAPIFSRPPWLETNANPRIAAALTPFGDTRFGAPVQRGIDIPNAIDDATDRANLFGVWQRLWRDGCGGNDAEGRRCRGAMLLAALQYRLSGERGFDETSASWRSALLPVLTREWQTRWPAGLAIPNPDLPSRDPLPDGATRPVGRSPAHVAANFEALMPRAPLEIWTLPDAAARRWAAGFGEFIPQRDVRALDAQLVQLAATQPRQSYAGECQVARSPIGLRLDCSGTALRLSGRVALSSANDHGSIDTLVLDNDPPLHRLTVASITQQANGATITLRSDDLQARRANGNVIDRISLRWNGDDRALLTLDTVDDFAPLRAAIDALAANASNTAALTRDQFNAGRVMAALAPRLGLESIADCCSDARAFAPARVEPIEPPAPRHGRADPVAAFYPMCASCHATGERSPPNFLAGSDARVAANLRQCAPRIYARLAMWRRAPDAREKTPMPPPFASTHGAMATPPSRWETLEDNAADWLREETGHAPDLDALLADGYEALRPCLPDERPAIGRTHTATHVASITPHRTPPAGAER